MNEYNGIGKLLIIIGSMIIVAGILLIYLNKIPFLGKLPGDFSWKGKNWQIFAPIGTSILLSIILSALFYIIRKFF